MSTTSAVGEHKAVICGETGPCSYRHVPLTAISRVAETEWSGKGVHSTTLYYPLVKTPMIEPTKEFVAMPGLSAEEAKKAPGATGGSTAAGSTEAGAEPRVTEAERRPDDLR